MYSGSRHWIQRVFEPQITQIPQIVLFLNPGLGREGVFETQISQITLSLTPGLGNNKGGDG